MKHHSRRVRRFMRKSIECASKRVAAALPTELAALLDSDCNLCSESCGSTPITLANLVEYHSVVWGTDARWWKDQGEILDGLQEEICAGK